MLIENGGTIDLSMSAGGAGIMRNGVSMFTCVGWSPRPMFRFGPIWVWSRLVCFGLYWCDLVRFGLCVRFGFLSRVPSCCRGPKCVQLHQEGMARDGERQQRVGEREKGR